MGMFQSGWFKRDSSCTFSEAVADALRPRPLRVIFASETGVAEDHARHTLRRLQEAGVSTCLLSFDALDIDTLTASDELLFLVSTCDDGDPPETADAFYRKHMQEAAVLPHLRYGLLALGDRSYADFCAFGRQLHRWLQLSGAQTWFEPIEMGNEDEAAAAKWYAAVDSLVRSRAGARSS